MLTSLQRKWQAKYPNALYDMTLRFLLLDSYRSIGMNFSFLLSAIRFNLYGGLIDHKKVDIRNSSNAMQMSLVVMP